MNLIINGEEYSFAKEMTILEILKELEIDSKALASAINGEVIKKERWEEYRPKEGDRVEFLHFVGGG